MNEWQLQEQLTNYWIRNPLMCREEPYQLVCWELMLPSWQINDKKDKWHEPSIDFIFYSESWKTFLLVELKNEIVGRKGLLSAYCQVSHRTAQFGKELSMEKIKRAHHLCYQENSRLRDIEIAHEPINFSKSGEFLQVIMAYKYPEYAQDYINTLKLMNRDKINKEISNYTDAKELSRFRDLDEHEFMITRSLDIDVMGIPVKLD